MPREDRTREPVDACPQIGQGRGCAARNAQIARLESSPAYGVPTTRSATADDGGSTGRLRSALDLQAPGDISGCVEAMAEDDGTALAAALE